MVSVCMLHTDRGTMEKSIEKTENALAKFTEVSFKP